VSTGRTILLGVLAVGAVAALGLAFIVWVTGEPPGAAPRPAAGLEPQARPAGAATPATTASGTGTAAGQPMDQVGLSPAPGPPPELPPRPAPPSGTEYTPALPRRSPRGAPPPMDLYGALAGVREEIKRCPGHELLASAAPAPAEAGPPRPGRATTAGSLTVLLLQLEPLDGAVRVAAAPVQSPGRATPELIGCAQKLLVGQTFPASTARSGPRVPMQFALEP